MRRVLRPRGHLLFVEHGRAPEPSVAHWQNWLNPVWKPIAGGCHLNRPIDRLITGAGFEMQALAHPPMSGPQTFSYLYQGVAAKPGTAA